MNRRLPQDYIPTKYDLYLNIREDLTVFDGSVTITYQKNKDADKTFLNVFPNIVIKSVTQNGQDLEYEVDYPRLQINRSKDQSVDFNTYPVRIDYQLTLNDDDEDDDDVGLTYSDGCYMTDFEPNGARKLLPCFDEPCIRSSFCVKVRTNCYLTAVSNMPVESITQFETETEYAFQPTPPMCTYLLCLCIGPFGSITCSTSGGTLIEYFCKKGKEESFRKYIEIAKFSVEWLEAKFKVKYELPCLQLISLEGYDGGMENYGLITLQDYSSLEKHFQFNATVIMHEVAHQWFGDLVCIKYWDSLWLNEGFAEFVQYLILRDFMPEIDAFNIFTNDEALHCLLLKREPEITPDESNIDFDSLFDGPVYTKGAFVVKMFFDLVGEANFFKAISEYLDKFKNKCVDVNDFVSSINKSLNSDFSSFFDAWLRKPSFPIVLVHEVVNDDDKFVGFTLTQVSSMSDCVYKIKLPILYGINGEIKTMFVTMDDFFTQVDLEFDWIIVNHNFASLCLAIYSVDLLQIISGLKVDDNISFLDLFLIKESMKIVDVPEIVTQEMLEFQNYIL